MIGNGTPIERSIRNGPAMRPRLRRGVSQPFYSRRVKLFQTLGQRREGQLVCKGSPIRFAQITKPKGVAKNVRPAKLGLGCRPVAAEKHITLRAQERDPC